MTSKREARANILLSTSGSAKKEGGQRKRESLKSAIKQTDYERSLTKSFEAAQKREQGKVLHNSSNNHNYQSPLSFLTNMVQT